MRIRLIVLLVLALLLTGVLPAAAKDAVMAADQYDATTMDPIGHNDVPSYKACRSLYDTLIFMDDDGTARPGLAESWEVPSGTEYKMHLRKGVKFHNGEEMRADDVKFTFERAASPQGAKISIYSKNLKEVEVVDDHTVVIRLKEPDYSFFPSLAHGWAGIVNRKAVEAAGKDYGTMGAPPVGTGPLKFASWQKGDRYTLERFDEYWGDKVRYKTLTVRSIPETTNRVIALETGEADIIYPITANDIARIESDENLVMLRMPQAAVGYMGFNTTKKPFDDARVRRAFRAALDVPTMHKAVWRGIGKIPRSLVPVTVKYSLDAQFPLFEQDQDLARKLFAEAGVDPKGLTVQLWTNERKERIDMATIIQAQLAELGITVQITVMEWGAYLNGMREKKHDLFLLGWVAPVQDPNFSLASIMDSTSPSNNMFFNDPVVDELLVKGRQTPDGPEREKIYHDLQARINEQCPMVYLYNDESTAAIRKEVKGFKVNPSEIYSFRDVHFED